MTVVYKILSMPEWEDANTKGVFLGSSVDLRDGFIHFSTAQQTQETVVRHFPGAGKLVLVAADADILGAGLRWEPSRGGVLFPHLFKPLRISEILWAAPFDAQRPNDLQKWLAE